MEIKANHGAIGAELRRGERFRFGSNWRLFLRSLDPEKISNAENSLSGMLEMPDLKGKTFLDAGSGSGLFSLAARKAGASVVSFDYDPQSVECAIELKRRYFDGDSGWKIERGSVLDNEYLSSLGVFDVVYSWGVLHHTGDMWKALANMAPLVKPGGRLFIAIYNDQGFASRWWKLVKKIYNKVPPPFQFIMTAAVWIFWEARAAAARLLRGENPLPFAGWKKLKSERGMSIWRDMVDWVGGYPFEVAKPEEIFDFYRKLGFLLCRMKTCAGSHGCNEFVFEKSGGQRQA